MRLGPIILSWAMAMVGWLGPSSGITATAMMTSRAPRSRDYELSTEFFLVPSEIGHGLASVASVISVPAPNRTITVFRTPPGVRKSQEVEMRPTPKSLLKQRPWALPLAALSAAAMLLMAGFEVFVLFKARTTAPNRRHLFLGQALLLGLFLLAGLSAAASLSQNPLSCAAFRLVGLPAALVFAALLVKCVFLLSLNSGVYLPAPYQTILFLICHERLTSRVKRMHAGGADVTAGRSPLIKGDRPGVDGRVNLIEGKYPGALLVAVACLAIRARGVRDNNREAAFIGLAVGLSLPIWISSGIGTLATGSEGDREAWLAYGLLATSLFVFLTMFLPKGRQLAALGREGPTAVIRDHDDALSSLPGSGYSPSFFHFKPAEASLKRKMHYHSADVHGPMETFVLPPGMYLRPEDAGNLYTTLSANPNVFFQRAAHPGMMY
ncbi:hypothetical protein G5I_09232 [Acromyrmex echinatior]|uniref:G-protein coupled receptors family 3 profile domain-containing protein n=1 Tax=Acromyrmex echinatior TaxID=103372 RepID=F4WTM6_ACREC|nr:hypothetical protein G5I_09232 [Acromyrmex echinatior]